MDLADQVSRSTLTLHFFAQIGTLLIDSCSNCVSKVSSLRRIRSTDFYTGNLGDPFFVQ